MRRAGIFLVVRRVGNLSYTPLASMSCFRFVRVSVTHCVMQSVGSFGGCRVCLTLPVLESVSSFGGCGISLTSPVLETVWSFVGGGGGCFSYTPRARVCQIFRQVGRLSFKPYTGIYLIGRWVNSLC